jgi:hypothetical protein
MKRTVIGLLVLLTLILAATAAHAQTPVLQIYYDSGMTQWSKDCPTSPPGTEIANLYFVVHNFNSWISALEFRIDYPPRIVWLGDVIPHNTLSIGNTQNGIALAWPAPFDAFSAAVVAEARFVWMCDNCYSGSAPAGCAGVTSVICPVGYPSSGLIRAVRWPDQGLIHAAVGGAWICPLVCDGNPSCEQLPVPVEETTWGGIKAMYR